MPIDLSALLPPTPKLTSYERRQIDREFQKIIKMLARQKLSKGNSE